MRYYLGVDQGGTKTAAVVCGEDGRILGSGLAEGLVTVYKLDREEVYLRNIRMAAGRALEKAGLGFGDVDAACGCLNGADWSFEYPFLAKSLYRAVDCRDVTVINDCIGAMRGGTASRQCAVVCVGTGVNVAVRRRDGRQIIYGYYIHDRDQGATALGKKVLERVMDAHNGLCPPTLLTEMLLEYAGYPGVEAMAIQLTVGGHRLEPKNLAQLLLSAYRRGDGGAEEILHSFADRMARYVEGGLRSLEIREDPAEVVYSGSVLKDDGTLLAERITERLRERGVNARGIHARYEPVCGALLTLLDRCWGGELPGGVLEAFDEGAKALDLIRNTRLKAAAL